MLLLFLTDSSRNYLDCGGGYEQVVTFLPMRNGKVLPMGRQDTANGEARHCQCNGKVLNSKVNQKQGCIPYRYRLENLVYISYRNVRKKWAMPIPNLVIIAQ